MNISWGFGGEGGGDGAYKTPRVKMSSSMALWSLGSCSELITGMGIEKIATSVTTLTPAMMYQMVALSRQKPFTSGSQKAATGTQTRVRRKQSVIPQRMRNPSPNLMIFRRMVFTKMR